MNVMQWPAATTLDISSSVLDKSFICSRARFSASSWQLQPTELHTVRGFRDAGLAFCNDASYCTCQYTQELRL